MPSNELFEHASRAPWRPAERYAHEAGARLLVTGSGGSIGAALAHRLLEDDPGRLVLLERSEHHLMELERGLEARPGVLRFVLGDAGDRKLVSALLEDEGPRVIFHAAAHKQAPLLESQPFETCRNNLGATRALLDTAAGSSVERFVLLSTDKAVEPVGIMGVSKWLAEGVVRLAGSQPVATAVRLGNVWGSRGSVIPRFEEQLAAGLPLTVTDPGVRRFFLSSDEAVTAVVAASLYGSPGDRFVPQMGEPLSILAIAESMLLSAGAVDAGSRLQITGLRPGDKLDEQLVASASGERLLDSELAGLRRLSAPPPDRKAWTDALDRIDGAVDDRDGRALLEAIRRLLPDFSPGGTLARALGVPAELGLAKEDS